ncbi:MAG TPA: hypothetical protein EYQ26_15020 [Rhodospirillales bacterium]|nr:hypothetical protein [Rhodospirillales bacterium]
MSILKIARMGHPVLHQVASPVTDFKDPELFILIEDMIRKILIFETGISQNILQLIAIGVAAVIIFILTIIAHEVTKNKEIS